jgi:hypothetical protein
MKYPTTWQHDGSLRDIYIFNANLRDWQKALDFLRSTYSIRYRFDAIEMPLPADARYVFHDLNNHTRLLVIEAGGVIVHCHFFLEDEIEFDIDPREVNTESKEEAVVRFMRGVGTAVGKSIVLTFEGAPDWVCLRIGPGQQEPEYIPVEFTKAGPTMSRDEGLRMLARAMGIDENDHETVIARLLEAANRPHKAWNPPESDEQG